MAEDSNSYTLEPLDFWDLHKKKIIVYALIFLAAVLGYSIYAYQRSQTRAAANALFSEANTPEQWREVVARFPNEVVAGDALLLLADNLRTNKDYEGSVRALKEFQTRYPDHPLIAGAWLSLATTYEFEGKLDEAIATYQQTATKFPKSSEASLATVAQARLLAEQGKKEEAIRLYESFLAQNPNSILSQKVLGDLQILKR